MKRALLALALLSVLCGCEPELRGVCTVIDKSHTDSFTTFTVMSTGKTTMVIPQFHPATWRIRLQENERAVGLGDSERRTAWYDVPDTLYAGILMGAQIEVRQAEEMESVARATK